MGFHPYSFIHAPRAAFALFLHGLRRCGRDHSARKAQDIYYVALCRKSFKVAGLCWAGLIYKAPVGSGWDNWSTLALLSVFLIKFWMAGKNIPEKNGSVRLQG